MRVEFLGGVRTVTGSATLLEKGSIKWLVDCGMFQGGKHLEERNWNLQPYQARKLSFILLTHAHIDHSGLIPRLVKEGFRGKVICTEATFDLCEVMLKDSGHIHEMEAEWLNRKGKRAGRDGAVPLYTMEDAGKCLQYFDTLKYNEMLELSDGVRVRFQDAGHILGSALIEVWIEEAGETKKAIFSGDLGNFDQPLIRDPSVVEEGDVLWLESTYGERLHKTREETVEELSRIIQEAIAHQAKVIIPAFAVGRTQDIIYTIGELIRKGSIPSVPVYIDSPLAISATEIFKRNTDCFDREARELLSGGKDPLAIPGIIFTRTREESKTINEQHGSGIIVSASGMCDSGRIQHHLKHHLWREESHIVIIGFQAEGTIGRRIVDGAKFVRLFGEEIAVKAHIHTLGGFSAHADRRGLLNWLSHFKNPRLEVFVNHGEEKISMKLGQLIGEQLHLSATVPEWREKKVLFGRAEGLTIREEAKEETAQEKPTSVLLSHLDRTYKRLRRKIKKVKKGEEDFKEQWLRELEQVERRLEELEKEL